MISLPQAIVLGLLQGVSELFPISSLGHSIILPDLLGWRFDSNAADVVGFLVTTHLATALVLFFIYWRDWVRIIRGIFRSIANREISPADTDARLGWLLVIGTIPVGIVGLLFEKQAKAFFTSPAQAAAFLIVNGVILFVAELLRRRRPAPASLAAEAQPSETTEGSDERLGRLSWAVGFKIGILQVLALFPGISRTGSAMTGGLLNDLSREDALRFSFLLATPVIGAAALLELPGLFAAGGALLSAALAGAAAAAVAAYLSAKYLVEHFKTRTLIPFAAYCVIAGALSLLFVR